MGACRKCGGNVRACTYCNGRGGNGKVTCSKCQNKGEICVNGHFQ